MFNRKIIWLPVAKSKLVQFRSERYSPEETLDFISTLVLEIESFLENPVLGKSYTEEFGLYKGLSRVIIRRFRVYYETINNTVFILAIVFPGEK